jgi:hypothetical protein
MILWGLAFFGVLAIYWHIPTWFSRTRQLKIRETRHFTPDGIEVYGPNIPEYKYFNAEGEEVRKLSDKEKITSFILFIVMNIFLINFAYDKIMDVIIKIYPNYENIFLHLLMIVAFITPFLIRHIYCFVLNRPMDTSFAFEGNASTTYIHKYDDRSSQSYNYATNPIYSYMPSNQYHYRHK